jgi:predicted ribosomally synthesized peptide with SipW-like signal peptide
VKKILILIISIGLILGLVGIGTQAYFSDVKTSSGNIFTAGTWENPKVTAVDATTQDYIVTVTIAAPSTVAIAPSTIATITSENYTVSADGTTTETITNIPFGTAKATFLASLTKGETNQRWADTGIADTVVTGNTLVVTAQDGTTVVTYTVDVVAAPPAPEDTTAPVITLLGEDPVNLNVGETYTDAGATAIDNVDGDITAKIVTTGLPINTDTTGTYTITYNVSNIAGNSATQVTRTVNVVAAPPAPEDTTAPVITLLGEDPVNLNVGETYTDAGATALDNGTVDLTGSIVTTFTPGPVDTSVLGTFTVQYNVSDAAGNPATEVTRTVIVNEQF